MSSDATDATITAYQIYDHVTIGLFPAPIDRDWMDAAHQRHPYRCLPLNIANQNGWVMTCPTSFRVYWYGGPNPADLEVRFDGDPDPCVSSHFGSGVLTFSLPYLFRTPPGINLWVKGPSNYIKDGVQALEGVVETDWAPSTFTMNWKVTRANEWVAFGKGEPICMIVPIPRGFTETMTPRRALLDADPELKAKYRAWEESRKGFLKGLKSNDPETVQRGWQKDYFQGKTAEGGTFTGHQTRLAVRGDGPPVLFIQGVGVVGNGWKPQVDGLADRYRCLTFDNRGMGASQPAGCPITVEQMAEDARVLMGAQGWDSAHVVGHSLGGLVALHLALTERTRVRSLALMNTFASGRHAAPLTLRMLWLGMRSRIGTRRMRRLAFLRLVMPAAALATVDRDALAANLAPLFGHDLGELPPVVDAQLKAMRAYDAVPRLGELAGLPTLVVSGFHDPIAPPKAGRVLAGGIPGSRYVEVADASHGFPIQFPDRANALLAEHFGTADRGS